MQMAIFVPQMAKTLVASLILLPSLCFTSNVMGFRCLKILLELPVTSAIVNEFQVVHWEKCSVHE